MFKKIVDESHKESAEVETEKLVEHLNVQRRSTDEDQKEQLAKAVEKFQQVMNSVIENPGNRFADINKMMNAENELDLAVHKVKRGLFVFVLIFFYFTISVPNFYVSLTYINVKIS